MAGSARAQPNSNFGTELVREWVPEGDPQAYVVLVHGLAEHCGRYERVASQLAGAGLFVRGFDLMGAGASGGRRWYVEDWSQYHDQVGSHVDWARAQGKPVVLFGHSLGGAIALGYSLSDRSRPDLLVLSAPALAGGTGWQRAIALILARLAPKAAIPNPVRGEQLSRDPAVAAAYFADPLVHPKSTLRFGALAFAEIDDLNDRLGELDLPTLVIHGGDDRLVPTASSEPLAGLGCVERRVYEGLRHETMNEPEGPEVVAGVIAWIKSRI